jgi:hypothetical protein
VAQPGDPYGAVREQRQREAAQLFGSADGISQYAARVYRRSVADLMFLSLWRVVGAQEAGARVCERFGHDPRGRLCERCGAYVQGGTAS